jgi:hypothetical protein
MPSVPPKLGKLSFKYINSLPWASRLIFFRYLFCFVLLSQGFVMRCRFILKKLLCSSRLPHTCSSPASAFKCEEYSCEPPFPASLLQFFQTIKVIFIKYLSNSPHIYKQIILHKLKTIEMNCCLHFG